LFRDPNLKKNVNSRNIISVQHSETFSDELTGEMVEKHMSPLRNNCHLIKLTTILTTNDIIYMIDYSKVQQYRECK
jgi:hypothetical protein